MLPDLRCLADTPSGAELTTFKMWLSARELIDPRSLHRKDRDILR